MNNKSKRKWFASVGFSGVVALLLVLVMVLTLGLEVALHNMRMEGSKTETVQSEVVDKYYQYHKAFRGGGYNTYHLTLRFLIGGTEYEETIELTEESFYNDAKIGGTVSCDVVYDEDGVIRLEVADTVFDQYTPTEQSKDAKFGFLVGVCIVIAVFIPLLVFFGEGHHKKR